MNGTQPGPSTLPSHDRWAGKAVQENTLLGAERPDLPRGRATLCRHMIDGRIDCRHLQVLLNNITGLEVIPGFVAAVRGRRAGATSNEATDVNGDGEIRSATKSRPKHLTAGAIQPQHRSLRSGELLPSDGRVLFVADGSALINAMYDSKGSTTAPTARPTP